MSKVVYVNVVNPQWKTSFFVQCTRRKKKEVACRFKAPWAPSNKTRIILSEEKIDETIVNQSKKLIERGTFL